VRTDCGKGYTPVATLKTDVLDYVTNSGTKVSSSKLNSTYRDPQIQTVILKFEKIASPPEAVKCFMYLQG
jgi:hypothetical protein